MRAEVPRKKKVTWKSQRNGMLANSLPVRRDAEIGENLLFVFISLSLHVPELALTWES